MNLFNKLFLVFLAMAALLLVNAVSAFMKARGEGHGDQIAIGVVSLLAAAALGHFMFNF